MPRQKSKVICCKCGSNGFIGRRTDGAIGVQIPTKLAMNNISEAWDYAARVCLRCREILMLYEPSSEQNDEREAQENYKHISRWFGLHTEEDIKAFESKHSSLTVPDKKCIAKYINAKNKPNEDAITAEQLPDDIVRLNKFSISWLYAAIVCKVFSSIAADYFYSEDYEHRKAYAKIVYSYFSSLVYDLRYHTPTDIWFDKIIPEVRGRRGYHAAGVNIGYSTIHVKQRSKELVPKKKYMEKFLDEGHLGCAVISFRDIIDSNSDMKEIFLKRFEEQETEATKGNLLKNHFYYIRHNESGEKKECPFTKHEFASIGIDDERYPYYKKLVDILAESTIDRVGEDDKSKRKQTYDSAKGLLRTMGWPDKFTDDKIREDFNQILLCKMTASRKYIQRRIVNKT